MPSVSGRRLAPRKWLAAASERLVAEVAGSVADAPASAVPAELDRLVAENHRIHDKECINLNPATNIMNPRAEAMLSSGLGPRASLGHPGDKYA